MLELLFGPALAAAIVFSSDSDLSVTALSFAEKTTICLRGPYGECQTASCKSINEGQLALDVEAATAAQSILFSRLISIAGDDDTKAAQILAECVPLAPGSIVQFRKSEEPGKSPILRLSVRQID